jgi:glycosyltransferase involved in cell wall biosynthesis
MNICRIIYDWPPPWQGLAPHPYEITVAQANEGHSIEIFCGRWPKAGPVVCPKNTTIYPIMREPFPGTIFFTSSVVLFFKYLSWHRSHDVDVIHAHGHFAIWLYLYRLCLKKFFPWSKELKTPLVAHFHNTTMGRWEALSEGGKTIKPESKYMVWPIQAMSDRWAIASAAACIFVSQGNIDEAVRFYKADPKRCFLVETGVNTELFTQIGDEEKEKSRKELGLDMYDKVILNHGVMLERKNIHLIVEALKLLPSHYKLILAGPGDPSYMAKLDELIKGYGLVDRVIKLGYTPYPQVPIAYQMSDVFVLPSSFEGLPKVVMQGLACGIPCLVSGFKLSEELAGLFYLANIEPATIAKQLREIVEASPAVEVDVNKVIVHYSWERRVHEIDKIYEFAKKNYI